MSHHIRVLVVLVLALLSISFNVNGFSISSTTSSSSLSTLKFSTKSIIRNNNKKLNNLDMRWGLKGPQANVPMGKQAEGVSLRDTVPFELRGFSLPLVVFSVGIILTATSFAGFFSTEGGDGGALSGLGFVYGIPVFLIGLSLWYAEIPPVVVDATPQGEAKYAELATDTMQKIRQDVTRHRYGDDAHLDSTLETLGLKLPQKKFPRMKTIILDETPEGELSYTMTFQSLETPFKVWADPERVMRYNKFFGPGIRADIIKIDSNNRMVGLRLVTTSKGDPTASLSSSSSENVVSSSASASASADDF